MIQPHSDDLLFSCSHLLFDSQYDKDVLTIENNPKRIAEDEKLYEFLDIPFQHLHVDFDDQSYYGYHKKYKEVTPEDSIEYLTEFFGEQVLKDIEAEFSKFINSYFEKHRREYVTVVAPWGIGHPFHLFTRMLVEKGVQCSLFWYYREFPHSYKRRSQAQVQKQLNDYELTASVGVEEFDDVKWGLAKKFYKSQSSLLWFEQGYIKKKLNEEMYINKEQKLPFS